MSADLHKRTLTFLVVVARSQIAAFFYFNTQFVPGYAVRLGLAFTGTLALLKVQVQAAPLVGIHNLFPATKPPQRILKPMDVEIHG